MKLIKYQNMRGGRVVFQEIAKPVAQEWSSALHAVGMLYLLIHFLVLNHSRDGVTFLSVKGPSKY